MTTQATIKPERTLMHRARIGGLALLLVAAPMACDTNVSNPGPVQDEFLNDRNAAAAMVNGGFRHLVVMGDGGVLGVISVRDIIKVWVSAGAPLPASPAR